MRAIEGGSVLIIFGVTGDVSQRKLLPALFDLEGRGVFPDDFHVVGVARRELSHEDFQCFVRDAIARRDATVFNKKTGERFLSRFSYSQAFFDDKAAYERLGDHVRTIEVEGGDRDRPRNRIFYLATPPDFYEIIFRELSDSGLVPERNGSGWTRVLVEKPFGTDSRAAEKLDELLGTLFAEDHIFRVDHYIAKEAVQNITTFRFKNTLFESLWNKDHIDRVDIRLLESSRVGGRGSFYDGIGALRDVGQNHLLQMLVAVAMEEPTCMRTSCVREARAAVFRALARGEQRPVRAQYEGYRKEAGVSSDSTTETYFRVEMIVDNQRWRGVPFILESGKAQSETKTEIAISVKPPAGCSVCAETPCVHRAVLTFRIQPDDGISLRFFVKKPGFTNHEVMEKCLTSSCVDAEETEKPPDAHERLLYDALMGDQTLFASREEVHESWRVIDDILREWRNFPLTHYAPGTRMS